MNITETDGMYTITEYEHFGEPMGPIRFKLQDVTEGEGLFTLVFLDFSAEGSFSFSGATGGVTEVITRSDARQIAELFISEMPTFQARIEQQGVSMAAARYGLTVVIGVVQKALRSMRATTVH